MAKKKKKGTKHQTFYKAVKPFIKDNRVLLALLGAVGAGVALGKMMGPDRAGNLIDGITATVKHLAQPKKEKEKKDKSSKKKKKLKPTSTPHPLTIAQDNSSPEDKT
ncbi:hypothetical protein [Rufibacter hautae]|uniref:Uncharacterized protein n=1 Tax=Rufibacter hautae TaxID=2595005 RepID=A0A5B6TG50_9BACT|nr:hypothetical protein [Rufibacter hautae]KAA3439622.1 hypothetical protein FOA19_02790 [Rufibacter hautae]